MNQVQIKVQVDPSRVEWLHVEMERKQRSMSFLVDEALRLREESLEKRRNHGNQRFRSERKAD
jgi:hypothetical protein